MNEASGITRAVVRAGSYHDSVVLMQLQRALAALPGVIDAGVVMATLENQKLLVSSGLGGGEDAGPDDLLIVIKAESEEAAGEALSRVDALLQVRRGGGEGQSYRPHSLATAVKHLPEARWVLVSVPGRYAADVADEALDHGRNVFLYSDNVSLEREVALKTKARDRGLLVLGPDCGTAVVGGVGFGFANRVRRGPVGLVGASGTGLQAVMSHIHHLGSGISQAIGTGGRDLSAEVGGITAAQSLDLLRRDPETRVIVLLGKPPAPEVRDRLLAFAASAGKPVVVYFLGEGFEPQDKRRGSVWRAESLKEAAELAVWLAEKGGPKRKAPFSGYIRGLFSGGTLAFEALRGLHMFIAPIWSNFGLPQWRLADPLRSQGHAVLDLGADEFTVGRLHPMIDQDLRLRRLRQEAADPDVSVILLDVVLGDGAHADPAGELAPVIAQARAKVLVIVIGTDEDPQGLAVQIETLERAGALVFRTVTDAVLWIELQMEAPPEAKAPSGSQAVPLESVQAPVAAINIGLESFQASLAAQGAEAVQMDWRPPAGGNEWLAGILSRMKSGPDEKRARMKR